jgi:release factor glutamine methyltransferase
VSTEEPWTVERLLDWTTRYLHGKGAESVQSARSDAQLLLAHALGWTRTRLYTDFESVPSDEQRAAFRELVQQRVKGKPVAYLLGRKGFFLLDFEVNPDVLIPRPDTETLVTDCLRLAKPLPAPRILDVGTGSGCIAISLAHQHKGAALTATDVSPAALAVARRNAERHQIGERIRFLEGDLFAPLPPGETFDFIVSNPPYIPHADLGKLEPDVRDHEPPLALDGGPDGFALFDRLVVEAPRFLAPGGYLLIEIGFDQEQEGRRRLAGHPGYELAPTSHDLAGHPRVLRARWSG